MSSLLRFVVLSVLFVLFFPQLAVAQCAAGDEVCLQAVESGEGQSDSNESVEQNVSSDSASAGEITTKTHTEEQAKLVAQITHNLKRRRLTRPAGDNAFEQIQRLKEIHPQHDYSVNGTGYIARVMMVLGRRALRRGDPLLAEKRLQQAIKFDPQVARLAELRANIDKVTGKQNVKEQSAPAADASKLNTATVDPTEETPAPLQKPTTEAQNSFTGKVTTETITGEQAELVDGITRDLKQRRLIRPIGNNALLKIQRLKEVHPAHDYSVNGTKYIARVMMGQGRRALRQGDLDLASRHMLKAIQFDPDVTRQDELKKAIAEAARDRVTEQETKAHEQSATVTGYLQSDHDTVQHRQSTAGVEFVAPVMVAVPAGTFMMGSNDGAEDEKPVHSVVLGAFSISKHEITLQQYGVFALATGRPAPQYLPEEGYYPVTNVSWRDAVAYADWLSQRTQRLFRLPSESEWEYAARGGTTSAYFTGDTLFNAANCVGCGGQWDGNSVAPVGSFAPNEFGLYDTHGNVWEWVQDCWTDNYHDRAGNAAAITSDSCERHVLRGGSWNATDDYARVSYRGNEKPFFRDGAVGFRVVHEGL